MPLFCVIKHVEVILLIGDENGEKSMPCLRRLSRT